MTRLAGLAALLLLAGCLEAADLAEERLLAPDYCPTPDGITLCEKPAGAVVVK